MLCQPVSETSLPPWKEPAQARGRARVDMILGAAADLAAEQGHLDFKMTTVAERAKVPIGSLYQFFPSRTALVARLFAREMEPVDGSLSEGLASASTTDAVLKGIGGLIRSHVEMVKSRPALFVIWSSPTMEPALQEADFQNSKVNAAKITERLMALAGSSVDRVAVEDTALLVCHLWGHVVRLSVLAGEPSGVIDQYIAMIEAHFENVLAN
ncbi:MAG: TetR/AcrR family transcriptional regulator [Pseudomonadota bacterium]